MSNHWTGRRVAVTGAGGFIGSHLVDRLVAEGAEVRALLRYNSRGDIGALAWESDVSDVEILFGDLRDPQALDRLVADVDTVLHLGALIAIPYSYVGPRDVVETNVGGTQNVLAAALAAGCERVVSLSTSEVYGTPRGDLITEDDPLNAQSPYAASKVAADQLALSYHRSFGLPVGVLRPFNTYGPRQSARAVIPTILSQGLAGLPLTLGSLHPVRDFLFVADTVAGILDFAAWEGAAGAVVQLGTGVGVRIGDVVERAGELLGRELEVMLDEQRVRPPGSEVQLLIADASLARESFGWTPRTSLEIGLRQTADWIGRNLERYRPDIYAV